MKPRLWAVLVFLGFGLLMAACVLMLNNITVDILASDYDTRGPAGAVQCTIAPWDAGANHNDNEPGGEHHAAYYTEVGSKCYAANIFSFWAAIGSLGLAAAMMIAGVALGIRAPRARTT